MLISPPAPLIPPFGWRRGGILGLATVSAAMSFLTAQVDAIDLFVTPLWTTAFMVEAVLLVALALRPGSGRLYSAAGALAVVALLSRPAAVFVNWQQGLLVSGWLVLMSVLVFGGLAAFFSVWWLEKVGPWHVRHRAGVLANGD